MVDGLFFFENIIWLGLLDFKGKPLYLFLTTTAPENLSPDYLGR